MRGQTVFCACILDADADVDVMSSWPTTPSTANACAEYR